MICHPHLLHPTEALEMLNRLLPALNCSLARYLEYGNPWAPAGTEAWTAAIHRVAHDHALYAQRLEEVIRELHGRPNFGSFPIRFTAINDLDVRHLAGRVAAELRATLPLLEEAVAAVADVASARHLAEEILGNSRGHLEALDALTAH